MCRVGGEVEESIIHGYSNKYHDGFLGHAYVGEWVNLGALTTNSDLKNDYSSVSVVLDGNTRRHRLDQGRLADRRPHEDLDRHAVEHGGLRGRDGFDRGHGQLLPKFIPSFAWFLEGVVTKGFGKKHACIPPRKPPWAAADGSGRRPN